MNNQAQQLVNYLKDRGISKDTARDFNLVLYTSDTYYLGEKVNFTKYIQSYHKNSIIFPIQSVYGSLVGVSSKNPTQSKYLHKGKKTLTLFGLHTTWKHIVEKNVAIIVEGNFDVLKCYEKGFNNVVGLLGSHMTDYQMCLLRRFTNRCIFAFDGDSAGRNLKESLMESFKEKDFKCKGVEFPDGEDPDSFLDVHGKKEFLQLIK